MDNARLPLNATICCYQYITVANSVGHYGCTRFCINFGLGLYGRIQGVQNPEAFIKIFMQRLNDCNSQNWHEHVSNSTRFSIYRMFKTSISFEPYFTSVTNKHIRDILIKFRIGTSNIRVHKMRYVAHTPQELLCTLCNTAYEDEMHISFYCKSLDDLRQKYIPRKYVVRPSVVTLRLLMQDESCLHDLGRFIYHSDKRRDQ